MRTFAERVSQSPNVRHTDQRGYELYGGPVCVSLVGLFGLDANTVRRILQCSTGCVLVCSNVRLCESIASFLFDVLL